MVGWEYCAAILLTIAAAVVHWTIYRHAGGLWRDEINSVSLAAMETLADLWKHIEYDSFPILWVLVLRCWQAIVGDGDTGYRLLGMLVGIGCLAALWHAARRLIHAPPLLSLSLFALSPVVLRFGDSLRAWGFGALWLLLMVTAVWDYAREPTRRRWWWAVLLSLLSVQASYYNAIFLFAVAMGGCAVCGARRDGKSIVGILTIGFVSALSLVPYYGPIARHRSWVILVEVDSTYPELLSKWKSALEVSGAGMSLVWLAICLLAVVGGLVRWRWPDARQSGNRDSAMFSAVSLVVGSVLYLLLLKQMHRITESWYYLTWMAFAGLLADVGLANACGANSWGRILRMAVAVAAGAYVLPAGWNDAHIRHTNVDLIARQLSQMAKPGDLIAVLYWEAGITFQRYYDGKAQWLTVPDIPEHRIHRYDLIKQKMENPDSNDDTILAGLKTLQSGGRVWLVGDPSVDPNFVPVKLPPPPLPETGWHSMVYGNVWTQNFKHHLFNLCDTQNDYSVGLDVPTSGNERCVLQMWQKLK